jgi:hypothetical protein
MRGRYKQLVTVDLMVRYLTVVVAVLVTGPLWLGECVI